jgi:hypothetical protein
VSRLSRQCEILNISEPYRPPRPVTGIFFYFPIYLQSVYIHLNTISKLCAEKRGRVEECSVAPLRDKRVKTLCGCCYGDSFTLLFTLYGHSGPGMSSVCEISFAGNRNEG